MVTATVRDLRTRFPRVKHLVAREGEVIVTDHGKPAFVLRVYEPGPEKSVEPVDYYRRLTARQPKPLSRAARRALDEANRGDR
jgi:antitoxin (DNA-binding transcriptional repressor) of toxin-antitoxin stability system